MKIITYNINGLRARISPYRSLHAFLGSLDADIICFQETKLSRQELTSDIAIAEGYESFFSCTRTANKGKIGYSGVATFCRIEKSMGSTSNTLPLAADEGFTGLLHCSKSGEIEGGESRVGCYEEVMNMGTITREELLQLDSEGRCVITDHSSFVLFNIYGPCAQSEDATRMQFKLNFFQALQCRWESLLRQGRRVLVVGDLNIAPFPVDSCYSGPDFAANPCRIWLRSLLNTGGGPFTDIFRVFHAERKDAYTCWMQASGAEEFNYGTRIDLILAAGPCFHLKHGFVTNDEACHAFAKCEVKDCDIMIKFKRSKEDSNPRWAGGRNLKLEGSDHAPVFVLLKEQPPVRLHNVPSLAARFLPQLRGRQQSIDSLLRKNILTNNGSEIETKPCTGACPEFEIPCGAKMHDYLLESTAELVSKGKYDIVSGCDKVDNSSLNTQSVEVHRFITHMSDKTNSNDDFAASVLLNEGYSRRSMAHLKARSSQKLKTKQAQKACQTSLKSFFSRNSMRGTFSTDLCETQLSAYGTVSPSSPTATKSEPESVNTSSERISTPSYVNQDSEVQLSSNGGFFSVNETDIQESSASFGNKAPASVDIKYNENVWESLSLDLDKPHSSLKPDKAQIEWKRIQDLMARRNPVCRGHGEPCAARIVKKGGPNIGRGFYVCARAAGPSSNPESRCDHFEWASQDWRK